MIFRTSDTALAAWLIANQVKLSSINSALHPVIFIFECDQISLDELVFSWESTNAVGNCYQFYKIYRSLIHKLKG